MWIGQAVAKLSNVIGQCGLFPDRMIMRFLLFLGDRLDHAVMGKLHAYSER